MSMAILTFEGHLGRAPETKDVGGSTVCEFTVAVNHPTKEPPNWYRVSVWGKPGEACQKYLDKGSAVMVSGELWNRSYTKKDGSTGVSHDVRASGVKFLGGSRDGGGERDAGGSRAPASSPKNEEIPF